MHPETRLVRNADGIWEIRWTERDARGKPRSKTHRTGLANKSEAEAYRVRWLAAVTGGSQVLATPTVATIVEGYIKACRGLGKRRSQSDSLVQVKAQLGAYRPQDLRGRALKDYRALRLRDVAESTLRRELGALTAALNWAADEDEGGLIEPDQVPKIKLPAAVHEERRYLKKDEEADFFARALAWQQSRFDRRSVQRGRYHRVAYYVAVGLNTGARKEAIEELTWDRIDMEARTIDFRRPGMRITKKVRTATPINDRLFAVLDTVPLAERWGLLIPTGNIRKAFRAFVLSTPTPWVTSHIMRHTFITLSLRDGVPMDAVERMVGDTEGVIRRYYNHQEVDSDLHQWANKRFR